MGPEAKEQIDRIRDYVRDNCRSTSTQIAKALGIDPSIVCRLLGRLESVEEVAKEYIDGKKAAHWSAVDEAKAGRPVRIEVKEWTGHKRDDLLTAFFGAATA